MTDNNEVYSAYNDAIIKMLEDMLMEMKPCLPELERIRMLGEVRGNNSCIEKIIKELTNDKS